MKLLVTKIRTKTATPLKAIIISKPLALDRDGEPLCHQQIEAPVIPLSIKSEGDSFVQVVRFATLFVPDIQPPQ